MKKKKVFYSTLLILLIILIVFVSYSLTEIFFSDLHKIRTFILGYGIYSPIVFILIQAIQVVLAPIPGQLTGLVGGYLFGVWKGTFYSMIGEVIGTWLIVLIAKKYGEPIVRKIVSRDVFNRFNKFCMKGGALTLFLIYLFPIFPDDAITFIAALSSLGTLQIVLLALFGRLPGMFGLSLIGAGIAESDATRAAVIIGAIVLISFVVFLYRKKLEEYMMKIIKKESS